MKLYYYKDRHGNVGDDLNPWLWDKLLPGVLDDDQDTLFLGIGTLLNDRVPDSSTKIVFGSGLGYGTAPPRIDDGWKFYCVRGPETARRLGLPAHLAITDPAALVATVEIPRPASRAGIAFMPHHVSAWNADWPSICKAAGLRYIDPRWDVERVLGEIGSVASLITEAMHGAILADTLRVPWSPVFLYDHILESKWVDWCQSLSIDFRPSRIAGIWDADYNFSGADRIKIKIKRALSSMGIRSDNWTPPPNKSSRGEVDRFINELGQFAAATSPTLSNETTFRQALDRLQEAVQCFRNDHAKGLYRSQPKQSG